MPCCDIRLGKVRFAYIYKPEGVGGGGAVKAGSRYHYIDYAQCPRL